MFRLPLHGFRVLACNQAVANCSLPPLNFSVILDAPNAFPSS